MTDIIRVTQEFYQRCRQAANKENSQEAIEANHVGWDSVKTQNEGFDVATDLSWINWKEVESVLDIGCGYGGLLEYLFSVRFYQGKYWGVDIMPNVILDAILNYGSKYKSHFVTGDFLEQSWDSEFDVVISLGGICVNHDYPNHCGQKSLQYAQKFISKAVFLSNSAVSLYFPNADNEIENYQKLLAYYKISEIEPIIIEASGKRLEDITFVSYPDPRDMKTIAKIKLKSNS